MQNAILGLAVLLGSVIIHENAHGVVALMLGDRTAKDAGRLTLNPVKHFDPVGSLILPAMLFFTTGTMFGYAKPVPVNPQKLHGKDRWGFALVAVAGPVSNVLVALVAAFFAARFDGLGSGSLQLIAFSRESLPVVGVARFTLGLAFTLNLLLASFNLLPIPPLDGSRLLRLVIGNDGRRTLDRIEPYGFLILLVLIVWLSQPLFRIVTLIQSGILKLLPV
jgi:Zn-dependent protease